MKKLLTIFYLVFCVFQSKSQTNALFEVSAIGLGPNTLDYPIQFYSYRFWSQKSKRYFEVIEKTHFITCTPYILKINDKIYDIDVTSNQNQEITLVLDKNPRFCAIIRKSKVNGKFILETRFRKYKAYY